MNGPRSGTVEEFDAHRGLGIVRDGAGGRWPFHCTRIADGTRAIAAGARVEFRIVPGLMGRFEAADLREVS